MNDNNGWNQHGAAFSAQQRRNKKGNSTMKPTGLAILICLLFAGVIVTALFTFLPGQLDDRYTGEGQVIGMVNPSGQDVNRDMGYSKVNINNADANLINSHAYQQRQGVWIFVASVFGVFALLFLVIRLTLGK